MFVCVSRRFLYILPNGFALTNHLLITGPLGKQWVLFPLNLTVFPDFYHLKFSVNKFHYFAIHYLNI